MSPTKKYRKLLFKMGLRHSPIPTSHLDLALYPESSRPGVPKYLNIGALDFPHPLWHNLDNPTDWGSFSKRQRDNIHVPHDLMAGKPLPIASETLAIAYCSHVIEHLRDTDVQMLFAELNRTLRPGGVFRLVAPDMALFYEAYQRGDEALFLSGLRLHDCRSLEQKLLLQFASSLVVSHPASVTRKYSDEEIRSAFRAHPRDHFFEFFSRQTSAEVQRRHPADHMNWFTPDRTMTLLKAAGFASVRQSAYAQSHLPILRNVRLFDPYPDHSLYFECTK